MLYDYWFDRPDFVLDCCSLQSDKLPDYNVQKDKHVRKSPKGNYTSKMKLLLGVKNKKNKQSPKKLKNLNVALPNKKLLTFEKLLVKY